nr:hypothetical protein [Tanacetum cinerariifolium]
MVKMVSYEGFACPCGAGDVVLRESYKPKTCEERVRLLVGSPGASTTLVYSPGSSSTSIYFPGSLTAPRYSPGASTPQSYSMGTSRNAECSNLQETYDKVDGSVVYNLLQKINTLIHCVKCSCDASKELTLHQQLMKLMKFLTGLDECYQPVRSALLTRDPLPDVNDGYNTVSREESHKVVLESFGVCETKMNATSFAAKLGHPVDHFLATLHNNFKFFKSTSVYLLSSSVLNGRCPYELVLNKKHSLSHLRLNKYVEPSSYIDSLNDNNWVEAMNNGIEPLNRNNTWSICDLPGGRKPIDCKWLFKIKFKASSEIEMYKARLVAKGYSQRQSFDYDEIFSPVVEDAYMTLPQGFDNDSGSKVRKLNKFLYGLKQASRQWNTKLTSALVAHVFVHSKFDYFLYVKSEGYVFVVLLVYVDDIVITCNDESDIRDFKKTLNFKFQIKDLGELKYFLGIEV